MSRPGAALVVEHVSKRFGARVQALRDASFALEPGELVLLSGPSGSGKSTLLNLIAGLDRPDAGRILLDGVPLAELGDTARYRRETTPASDPPARRRRPGDGVRPPSA